MELRSDAHGRFNLKAPVGNYDLTITAPGCPPHFQSLELKAAAPLLPLEIRLEEGGHRVQGRLLPDLGRELEGAQLCFFFKANQDKRYRLSTEVNQGRFDITLAAGDYEAFATAKGQAGSQAFKVRGSLPEVLIQLRTEPTPAGPETLAWIKQNTIPLKGVEAGHGFADLQPLKALVGDATVVGLGEATHGTR